MTNTSNHVTEEQSRQVAEDSREKEWKNPSFMKLKCAKSCE